MRNLSLLCSVLLLSVFTACKKENKINPDTTPKTTDPLELATDSGSFTIEGNTRTLNQRGGGQLLYNADANLKIDSVVKGNNYYISGNKDSVFFARTYNLVSTAGNVSMQITFCKKYAKTDMTRPSGGLYIPIDKLDLFKVGEYPYAIDYTRLNAHNGVVIGINRTLQTNINVPLEQATTISADAQKKSKFELTTFKKLKNGDYLLEAKFNATFYDQDEKPRKAEGYIRLRLS